MKKILAVFLSILMLITVVPATSMSVVASALTVSSTELLYGDADGLTRAEWLHNLAVIGELTLDENANMDNYFSDLTKKHKYYNDILLNLQFGVIDIEAGGELRPDDVLTRDFATSTLNTILGFQVHDDEPYTFSDASELWSYTEGEAVNGEEIEGETPEGEIVEGEPTEGGAPENIYADFIEQAEEAKLVTEQRLKDSAQIAINRGWVELVDGAFCPETVVTTTEIQAMLDDAIKVLDVTVIDENYENVFEFTEDVIVIPEGTVAEENIENNTVSITDCPVELAVGDKFAVYYYGIPEVYLAEEISVAENITTIVVSEVADEDAFTNVDAQGVIYDPSQIEVIPGEDVQVTVTEVIDEAAVILEPENYNALISYPEYRLAGKAPQDKIRLSNLNFTKTFEKGGKSLTITLTLNAPTISYYISEDYCQASLLCWDTTLKVTGEASTGLMSITMGKISVAGIGSFDVNLNAQVDGKITYTSKGSLMIGASGYAPKDFRNDTIYKQIDQHIKAEVTAKIGLNLSLNVKIPFLTAKAYAEMGIISTMAINNYLDGKKPSVCCHCFTYLYMKAGYSFSVGYKKWSISRSKNIDIFNHKNSPCKIVEHYEDGRVIWGTCNREKESGIPANSMINFDYITRVESGWFGSGWSGWNGSSGINAANEIVPIYTYTLNETNGATITSYNIDAYHINIPEKIDGYTVVGIGENAFKGKRVGHIVLPNTVTMIGNYAFANCNNLVSVDITDSVTTIGNYAFYKCYNLKEVSLPKNLITLGTGAFGFTAIPSVKIPKSLEDGTSSTYSYTYNGSSYSIYGGPFVGCDNLKNVTFEEGTVRIADYLFSGCTGLETINIPSGTEEIQASSFRDCFRLKNVNIPTSVLSIGDYAFYRNFGLNSINIPDSVTLIDGCAFEKCYNLKNIKLSKGLIELGYRAFYQTAIESIEIPKSLDKCDANWCDDYTFNDVVYDMHAGPFALCDNLKTVTFEKGTTQIAQYLFTGCTGLEEITIPDTVTTIEYAAFQDCLRLSKVTIGSAVTSIGGNAFEQCVSLTDITIPNSVTSIDDCTFRYCYNLKNVTLSKGLISLGAKAFEKAAIKSIEIPKSLDSAESWGYTYYYTLNDVEYDINQGPFVACDSLKTVTFEKGTTQIAQYLFTGCTGLEEIVIPDTVTTIEQGAFQDCLRLSEVTIGSAVTSIGGNAFEQCVSLTDITIPNSVTSIDDCTFRYCYNLKSVTLSKGLISLGAKAFEKTAIESIEIPKSLDKANSWGYSYYYTLNDVEYDIYQGPFVACDSLKTVTFEKGRTQIAQYLFRGCTGLEEIVIPDTVTTIEQGAFQDCLRLSKVTIGNAVTTIGDYAFNQCVSLPEISIPDSVTSMGSYIFKNCKSLESIKLPSSITTIPDRAFYNCSALKTIELPKTIENIEGEAFYGCSSLESLNFADASIKTIEYYAFRNCTSLKEAVLPETVAEIGYNAFQGCVALEKVYIPQSTKELGNTAFQGCEVLSDVTIKDYSITEIKENTFKDCPALEKIELPKGLTKIGANAFVNDTTLKEVVIPESVTAIDSTALSYPEKTTIYGKTGSFAETFATDNGFKFEPNGVMTEGILIKDGDENVILDIGETYRAEFEIYPEDSNEVITLTADTTDVTINGHDIYARYTGDTIITATTQSGLTYSFNVHTRDVWNIEVAVMPIKTIYDLGEEFDKTGMVVQAVYNDKSVKEVFDYTITGFDSSKEGEITVTISFVAADGYKHSTEMDLQIIDSRPKLTGIYVEELPTKDSYELREKVDYTGLVIMGSYTDGSVHEVTDYTVSGYNALKNGVQTITVKKDDFTTEFTLIVGSTRTVVDYEVIEKNNNFDRFIGESFSANDIKLKLVYDDGSCNVLGGGFSIATVDTSTSGQKQVELYYGNETIVFTVNVENVFDFCDMDTTFSGDKIITESSNIKYLEALVEVKDKYAVEVQESYVYGETKRFGTGSVVKIFDENEELVIEYKIIVLGDVNGDSICDVFDCMSLRLVNSGDLELTDVYKTAGDINSTGEITEDDFMHIVNKAVGNMAS